MKKAMGFMLFLLCLTVGGLVMGTSSDAATQWQEGKTIVVKKGPFTFKAHPALNKKRAWIYHVKVNPKKGSTKTLKFPTKIKGRKVTKLGWTESMGDSEFYKNIFDVWIEEAHGCDGYRSSIKKIQKMVIPKSVTEITNCTFSGMRALKKVTLPNNLKTLSRSMFYGCKKLKTVTLPKKLTEFDMDVFADCPSLKTMKISKSNKRFVIKSGMLLTKNQKKLIWVLPTTKKVTIPNKVVCIQESAFRDCSVKKLTIPAKVTELEEGALYAPSVTDIRVDAGNPVYARDGQCVYDKTSGELIVAIVKDKKVEISSKVTVLNGNAAMAGASIYDRVERVDIPASVKMLETYWMFFPDTGCKVYFHSTTPPEVNELVPCYIYSILPIFSPVYVPEGTKEVYEEWSMYHNIHDPALNAKYKGKLYIGFMDLHTF